MTWPDYPRERGATFHLGAENHWDAGLSPRARGNQESWPSGCLCPRTIPASAGQPRRAVEARAIAQDYPRERGATQGLDYGAGLTAGLSPRARGNLSHPVTQHIFLRTIPASAGQP